MITAHILSILSETFPKKSIRKSSLATKNTCIKFGDLFNWESRDFRGILPTFKSGTFKASPVSIRDCATVDYKGKLNIYDIERGVSKFEVQAHSNMGNQIDGIGGKGAEYGAPELVTGGSDGCVRVWDPRQQAPVVSLEPSESETVKPDCWAVAFGNAFN